MIAYKMVSRNILNSLVNGFLCYDIAIRCRIINKFNVKISFVFSKSEWHNNYAYLIEIITKQNT